MRTYRDVEIAKNLIDELKSCNEFLAQTGDDDGMKHFWVSNDYYSWVNSDEKIKHFSANMVMIRTIVAERVFDIKLELKNLGIEDV